MKCLYCGQLQPQNVPEVCGVCNFYLGSNSENSYKNQLARLADLVMSNQITLETFSNSLANMSSILNELYKAAIAWEEYIPEGSMPDVVRNVVMRPIQVMKEGISVFGEAIDTLGIFVVDPDEEHIVKGLASARRAHNMMVNSTDLAGFALREVKSQMPEGTAPSDEDLMKMINRE